MSAGGNTTSGGYSHVLREVDTGTEHTLRYPGKTLIGRARVNDIQPGHGSISKQHAIVEITGNPLELFATATVEDLHTRNGTYAGHPDRLNIINGKRPLKMGEYIKFGDCPNLYIFEAIRNPDIIAKPNSPAPLDKSVESLAMSPMRDGGNSVMFDDRTMPGGGRDSQAGTAAGGAKVTTGGSSMNISINYPADPGSQRQAVSIQIDPRSSDDHHNYSHSNNTNDNKKQSSALSPSRVSFNGQRSPGASGGMNRGHVSSDGELDLSGDFGSMRGGDDDSNYGGRYAANMNPSAPIGNSFGGSMSYDAMPRGKSPPSPMLRQSSQMQPASSSMHQSPSPSPMGRHLSPVTILTEKEREDVDKMRQSLAEGIRATNQVLAGVLQFDDWTRHARKIIGDAQLAVKMPIASTTSTGGATKTDSDFTDAELKEKLHEAAEKNKASLLAEVGKELSAEKPLPVESTMTGRLSSALTALRSLPMVKAPASAVGPKQEPTYNRADIHNRLEQAMDDILGAVETPLGMALEGVDSVTIASSPVIGRSVDAISISATAGGKVANLRTAVSKLKGLGVFFDSMAPEFPPSERVGASVADGAAAGSWWQQHDDRERFLGQPSSQSQSIYGTDGKRVVSSDNYTSRPPSTLHELIQSVEAAGPGDIQPIAPPLGSSSTLSREQLEQITKYIILSVIEEDIQPVLDRIVIEKSNAANPLNNGLNRSVNGVGMAPVVGMKHSDLKEVQNFVSKLSPSFSSSTNRLPLSNRSPSKLQDLEGELGVDGELRLSSTNGSRGRLPHFGGSMSMLNPSKLAPPGKGTVSPRTSLNRSPNLNMSFGGGSFAGSVNGPLSMSAEHVEQLDTVNAEIEVLEKKHQEELARLAKEVEDDKKQMQQRSEIEKREIEESRRREKERLEADMDETRQALLHERERVLEEARQAHDAMIQYILFRVLTNMVDLYKHKVQVAFKRWAGMTVTYRRTSNCELARVRQLKRVIGLVSSGINRITAKAFRKWAHVVLRSQLKTSKDINLGAQRELLRLREQCKAQSEQLRDIARGSDVYATLLAEKALNRELSNTNIELFATLNEAQLRMLEMAKIPTSEGKKLVRDVITTREGELARSRREVRALKDRLEHLERVITGTKTAAAEGGREFASSSENSKYRGGAVQGGLEVPGFMTSFMSDSSRRRADEQSTLEAIDYLAPAEQKKKQALSIILMELTRLRKVNAEQDSSQKYLSDTIARNLAKLSDMELAAHILQQRLSDATRRESSIVSYIETTLSAEDLNKFLRFMDDMNGTAATGSNLAAGGLYNSTQGGRPRDVDEDNNYYRRSQSAGGSRPRGGFDSNGDDDELEHGRVPSSLIAGKKKKKVNSGKSRRRGTHDTNDDGSA